MAQARDCHFLNLPLELRLQVYRMLSVAGHFQVRVNATKSLSPIWRSCRIYPAILAVNHQIKLEAQSALDEYDVWELRTKDLFGGFDYDEHEQITSKIWSNTTSAIEWYLRSGRIGKLHLVIDTTIVLVNPRFPGSPCEYSLHMKMVGERILLKHGLRYVFNILSRMANPPRVWLSWLDDNVWVWEERRTWIFGELLSSAPASCSYHIKAVPQLQLAPQRNWLVTFPKSLFIQGMKEDLGIQAQG